MIKRLIMYFAVSVFLSTIVYSRNRDFQTLTYFQNDTISLDLDLFLPQHYKKADHLPLVIFVHGGGFSGGNRLLGHPLAKYLAEKNIACASISYTLYMQGKNRSFGCSGIASEKMRAIQIAASQLWHATAFLVENSKEYHIDTTKIFIAGSSAGAETVIHAACWNREKMQLFDQGLSLSFRYAGVIGGSGATTDINLITKENMVPMMLFHGDKDNLVPYGTAAHHYCKATDTGWLMMFGSHTIAERLNDLGGTCELITVKGGDHSCAGRLVRREQQTIVDFVNRVLREKNFILFRTLEK